MSGKPPIVFKKPAGVTQNLPQPVAKAEGPPPVKSEITTPRTKSEVTIYTMKDIIETILSKSNDPSIQRKYTDILKSLDGYKEDLENNKITKSEVNSEFVQPQYTSIIRDSSIKSLVQDKIALEDRPLTDYERSNPRKYGETDGTAGAPMDPRFLNMLNPDSPYYDKTGAKDYAEAYVAARQIRGKGRHRKTKRSKRKARKTRRK